MTHPYAERIRAALLEAGASSALAEALERRGLEEVPRELSALSPFLLEDLQEALLGELHPASAELLVHALEHELVHAPPDDRPAATVGGRQRL